MKALARVVCRPVALSLAGLVMLAAAAWVAFGPAGGLAAAGLGAIVAEWRVST